MAWLKHGGVAGSLLQMCLGASSLYLFGLKTDGNLRQLGKTPGPCPRARKGRAFTRIPLWPLHWWIQAVLRAPV